MRTELDSTSSSRLALQLPDITSFTRGSMHPNLLSKSFIIVIFSLLMGTSPSVSLMNGNCEHLANSLVRHIFSSAVLPYRPNEFLNRTMSLIEFGSDACIHKPLGYRFQTIPSLPSNARSQNTLRTVDQSALKGCIRCQKRSNRNFSKAGVLYDSDRALTMRKLSRLVLDVSNHFQR